MFSGTKRLCLTAKCIECSFFIFRVFLMFLLQKNILSSFKGIPPGIFSRRFSSEKCPTLTVASFFFVRLQSHSDWATFLTIETTKPTTIRPSPVSGI